ncbi:MAG: hypothetical protein GTO45_05275 [Candidatus Aminicenantes bacterium]|nr:hypothetical protein [Candidatus Aminicenantes bacterium]NIN17496.1 hypothetical protein [Candidatus Aminicenantes bacterium]NIN41382.1 hypothetical protein [Candidatus Aminicenantes bacterium]NIN84148.1 hypothetical protein [Candidatus Aminicenantes bacterium]NIO86708.1 hypothetical protein [Candidatus Aminicenantes bacterium]
MALFRKTSCNKTHPGNHRPRHQPTAPLEQEENHKGGQDGNYPGVEWPVPEFTLYEIN